MSTKKIFDHFMLLSMVRDKLEYHKRGEFQRRKYLGFLFLCDSMSFKGF